MAVHLPIPGKSDSSARVRTPALVVLFGLLTLGLYAIWWWYAINRELADVGIARRTRGFGASPARSALALALGPLALFVPTVWTATTTFRRVQRLQRLGGAQVSSGRRFAALAILTLGVGGVVYLQSGMNRALRAQAALPTAPPLPAPEPAPAAAPLPA